MRWSCAQRLHPAGGEGRAIASAQQPDAMAKSARRAEGFSARQQRQACGSQDAGPRHCRPELERVFDPNMPAIWSRLHLGRVGLALC